MPWVGLVSHPIYTNPSWIRIGHACCSPKKFRKSRKRLSQASSTIFHFQSCARNPESANHRTEACRYRAGKVSLAIPIQGPTLATPMQKTSKRPTFAAAAKATAQRQPATLIQTPLIYTWNNSRTKQIPDDNRLLVVTSGYPTLSIVRKCDTSQSITRP